MFGAEDIRKKIYSQDSIMNIEKQYNLVNELEFTLYSSTRWMVKYLKKNKLDSSHILDHKDELFTLLSQIHKQNTNILIKGDEQFNQFFTVIDYLRFAVPAIVIKEDTHHSFKDVIVLFYSFIHEFNILEIILELNKVKITSGSDMILRNQVLQFIEFIIVHYTKKVLEFQRLNEEPEIAFNNFISNEKEKFYKIRENLDTFMTKEQKDIKEITVTVNQLMVSFI